MDSAAAKLIEQGVLGALVVGLAVVAYILFKELRKAQQAHLDALAKLQGERIDDARKHQEQSLQVTQSAITAITNSTNASLAVRESVKEVHDALADYNDTLREYLGSRPAPRSAR